MALALEVCSGFSAAVPVRAGSGRSTGLDGTWRKALKLVGQVQVMIS